MARKKSTAIKRANERLMELRKLAEAAGTASNEGYEKNKGKEKK